MPSQALALAKQNIQARLMTVLDRSQAPPANFASGQIHLGSYDLRATEQSLEEQATGAGLVFISHAQEGDLALGEFAGRFSIAVDLVVRSAAASDARDWLDDMTADVLAACDPANWGATAAQGPPPERIRWKTETISQFSRVVRVAFVLTFPWNA